MARNRWRKHKHSEKSALGSLLLGVAAALGLAWWLPGAPWWLYAAVGLVLSAVVYDAWIRMKAYEALADRDD